MVDSPQGTKAVDVEDTPISLEELQAHQKLRLAKMKAKDDLLASKSPLKLFNSCLVSPPDDEPLMCGPLLPCSLVLELESTTTIAVTDATDGSDLAD